MDYFKVEYQDGSLAFFEMDSHPSSVGYYCGWNQGSPFYWIARTIMNLKPGNTMYFYFDVGEKIPKYCLPTTLGEYRFTKIFGKKQMEIYRVREDDWV